MKKPTVFGKYLLLERLNVGGMAEVFVAKAFGVEGFERILAIKKILPTMAEDAEFITMFIDEARISVQLNHANVVHIHELGKHDDAYYIAMEYVSGKDLRSLLERFRRRKEIMPTAMAVFVATKICEGLDYAHRKKDARGQDLHIIHRDVSPQNILLSYEGEVKIIDFGIAKAANRSQKTQAGILKGKFGYMSPEQVRGLPIDRRSDVFAVGVIIYEMLTGEKLFVGESDFSTLEKVRNADVPLPRQFNPNIPAGLERVVMKSLAREAEDRYQWGSDLQEDLMRFLLAGDAIYSGKHLAAFMKDAFAEDLLREGEKLERYAEVPKPEQIEASTVGAFPKRPAEKEAPAAVQSRAVHGRAASGNAAVAYQGEVASIPPPTTDELAQMDSSADRTIMVSGDLKPVKPQTAVGLEAVARTEDRATGAGPAGRPRTSAMPEGNIDKTLLPGRYTSPLKGERSDTGSDLRPIETSGVREVSDHDQRGAEARPANGETSMPPRKPRIVIGSGITSGPTSLSQAIRPGGETTDDSIDNDGDDEPVRSDQFEQGDDAAEPFEDSEEEPSDVSAPPSEDPYDREQAEAEEEDNQAPVVTPRRPARPSQVRRPPAKMRVVAKQAPKSDGTRRWLLLLIAALSIVVIVGLGVAALKIKGGGKPTVYVSVTPEKLTYSLSVDKQPPLKSSRNSFPVDVGQHVLDVKPQDPGYQAVTKTFTASAGDMNRVITVVLLKKPNAEPSAPASDPTPEPADKPAQVPAPTGTKLVASKPGDSKPAEPKRPDSEPADSKPADVKLVDKKAADEKPAAKPVQDGKPVSTTVFTAVITSSQSDVVVKFKDRVAGKTPRVEIPNVSFDKPGEAIASKAGFEVVTIPLLNPNKLPVLELSFTLPKTLTRDPPKNPVPVAKRDSDPAPPLKPGDGKGPAGKAGFASTPLGAEVWVDGRNTGKKTPVPKPQALDFAVGKHTAVFKLDGKATAPKEFEIKEGEFTVVKDELP